MSINFKLYISCVLGRQNFIFINNLSQNFKNDNFWISTNSLYYLVFHFRFSSLFYSTQLVDIFSYEIPFNNFYFNFSDKNSLQNKGLSTATVYNFHVLNTQNRFFLFLQNSEKNITQTKILKNITKAPSIVELFSAANWLEREVAELHGTAFSGKKDLRNLMLQYGDSSAPFQKSFPSVGLKEMYYNPVKDTIIQAPLVLQI